MAELKPKRPSGLYPAGQAHYSKVLPLAWRFQGETAAEGREVRQQRRGRELSHASCLCGHKIKR